GVSLMIGEGGIGIWTRVGLSSMLIVAVFGVRISTGPNNSARFIVVVGVRISMGPNGSEKLVIVSGIKVSTGPRGSAAGATTILETISGGSTERVCIVCCLVVLIEIPEAVRNAEILLWR